MTDIEIQERELNRFWNELLTPGANPDARNVDGDAAATLHHLARMTRAPLPEEAVRRVEQGVQAYLEMAQDDESGSMRSGYGQEYWETISWSTPTPPMADGGVGASRPVVRVFASRAGVMRLAQLAATLVLLAALGGLFILVAPLEERVQPSPVLPAIPGTTQGETLLALTLPAEMLPHGGPSFASLSDYSLPAGAETSWEAADGACCPGLRLLYVVDGVLTIRTGKGGHIVRAGIDLDPGIVEPGASVTVEAGDALLMRFEDAFSSGNPGERDARFLEVAIIDGYSPLVAAPLGWVWHPDSDYAYGLTLLDRPATLHLFQTVLDPGAVLLPPPGAATQLGVTVADDLPLRIGNTDEIENLSEEPVTVHVATLIPVVEGERGEGG